MNKKDLLVEVFDKNGGVAKTSDFILLGWNQNDIYSLCKEGRIERITHGYYKLTEDEEPKEEQMLSILMRQGIVCVESALFYYGYSDFTPREWTIAVPRSCSRTVKAIAQKVPTKAYYIPNEVYHIGESEGVFNGITLPVYDRERTVCDCFKYRTKLDREIFNKAVNAYARDEKKNIVTLSDYAKKMGIYKRVMDVMEVLLNA